MKKPEFTNKFYISNSEINKFPYVLFCKPATDSVGGLISCPFSDSDGPRHSPSRMHPMMFETDVPMVESWDYEWSGEGLSCIRHAFLVKYAEHFFKELQAVEDEKTFFQGFYADRDSLISVINKIMGFYSSVLLMYDGQASNRTPLPPYDACRIRLTTPERIPITEWKFELTNGLCRYIPEVYKKHTTVEDVRLVMPLFKPRADVEAEGLGPNYIREYERRGETCFAVRDYKGDTRSQNVSGYAPFFFTSKSYRGYALYYASGDTTIYSIYTSATWDEARFVKQAQKFATKCFAKYAANPKLKAENPMEYYYEPERYYVTSFVSAKLTKQDTVDLLDSFESCFDDIVKHWIELGPYGDDVQHKFYEWIDERIRPLVKFVCNEIRTKFFEHPRID